jgi:DnaK suppressor protein
MEQKDIERLRQKLESQRHETRIFLRRVELEAQSLDADGTHDSADQSVISLSKESLFERNSERRAVLRLIEAALLRITEGSFGVCIGCGHAIQSRRLEALPWTQFCLRCQGELEEKIGSSLSARTAMRTTATSRRAW